MSRRVFIVCTINDGTTGLIHQLHEDAIDRVAGYLPHDRVLSALERAGSIAPSLVATPLIASSPEKLDPSV